MKLTSVQPKKTDQNSESRGHVFTRTWKMANYYLKYWCLT